METTNKKIFIKFNNQIVPKPEGIDYTLIPGKVYDFKETRAEGAYLEESKDFTFPSTYYLSDDDNKFVHKTIDAFNGTKNMTTGVLLSGIKGSGKTLMAKKIAVESGLPIIVIDPAVGTSVIEPFFAKTDTPCCIIFDEIDKYWNTRYLLSFLDGVKPTCKKLVLCTCNDEEEIDEYLNDRCSRIRYKRVFDCIGEGIAKVVINDIINDEEKATAARDFLFAHATTISYDNVIIFAEELRNNPNESFESVFEDLNITDNKEKNKEKIAKSESLCAKIQDEADCCEA